MHRDDDPPTADQRLPFPAERAWVLKLHRDSVPEAGCWIGRIEHLASGRRTNFASLPALLDGLAADAGAPPPR